MEQLPMGANGKTYGAKPMGAKIPPMPPRWRRACFRYPHRFCL